MHFPKISIITPSFNQGKYIEQTIRSVIEQHYPNLEYIIIDGGSSDNSVEIIKKYQSKITYWTSEKDTGQSHAINKGLKHATGDIVAWLCSDDLYLPGALHKVASVFHENPNTVMIHGGSILFGNGRKEIIKIADKTDLWLRYFSVIPFPQPSSFFRKKLIDEQGFLREDLHFAMDYELLIRAALHYNITSMDEIVSRYRLHKESKTVAKLESFAQEWISVFSKFIRSVEVETPYAEMLQNCDLYSIGEDKYLHTISFLQNDLKKIVPSNDTSSTARTMPLSLKKCVCRCSTRSSGSVLIMCRPRFDADRARRAVRRRGS